MIALVAAQASGPQASMSSRTRDSRSSSSAAVFAISCATPRRTASAPSIRRPLSARYRAVDRPTRRTTCGAICAGATPMRVSDMPICTSARTRVMSNVQAKPKPPPSAQPSTTPTVVWDRLARRKNRRPARRLRCMATSVPGPEVVVCSRRSRMSPPAQKFPPAPRNTTTRTLRLSSRRVSRFSSSTSIASFIALRRAGRLNVACKRPPSWRSRSGLGSSSMVITVVLWVPVQFSYSDLRLPSAFSIHPLAQVLHCLRVDQRG